MWAWTSSASAHPRTLSDGRGPPVKFDAVTKRLQQVRWNSAEHWSDKVRDWLREYYRRLAPWWPTDRRRIAPADRALKESILAPLPAETAETRSRISAITTPLWAAAEGGIRRVERTTKELVELMLAWALAVDEGALPEDRDPGVPLLEMFEAGYAIHYSHDGIELGYANGWMIAPVPAREDV